MVREVAGKINIFRGIGWLIVALLGAWVIGSGKLQEYGVNEYTARWLGVCFKCASGVWAGYRVSRDVLKIDPGSWYSTNLQAFALLHLARAVIVGIIILAVTQGV